MSDIRDMILYIHSLIKSTAVGSRFENVALKAPVMRKGDDQLNL